MEFIEAMRNIAYSFAGDNHFAAGFLFCLECVILVWVGGWLLGKLNVEWKKARQFIEPTKKPGKAPEVTGPSPAQLGCGCLFRLLLFLVSLFLLTLFILGRSALDLLPW